MLRDNKDKLLTVLEVMLHDPMYDWSVGASKAAAKQAGKWDELKKQDDGQGNRSVEISAITYFAHNYWNLRPGEPVMLLIIHRDLLFFTSFLFAVLFCVVFVIPLY